MGASSADGKLIAERFSTAGAIMLDYFVNDHLGSVAVVTDATGAVLGGAQGRLSYDPWGKARNANGTDDTSCSLPAQSVTTRGFTAQEQMADVCLINYNARLYDPQIGRFMAADTLIPDAFNTQSYNRYTYVENGPLSYTDPTGNLNINLGYGTGGGELVSDDGFINGAGFGASMPIPLWSSVTQHKQGRQPATAVRARG